MGATAKASSGISSSRRLPLLLGAAVALAGCADYHWGKALGHQQKGRPLLAVEAFERFAARHPADPRACRALVAAADIHAVRLQRCLEARRLYEAAARGFPSDPSCGEAAKAGLLSCPDYFPLRAGLTWVYGDSASGGRNMRMEWRVAAASATAGEVSNALYAGKKRIRADMTRFEKADWGVWEVSGKQRALLLRYPYGAGATWTARAAGRTLRYEVESDSADVRTKAGAFTGCLKVKEQDGRFPDSWKYDYYCPGVGRVKTTVAGAGFENPNTELLKFGKIP